MTTLPENVKSHIRQKLDIFFKEHRHNSNTSLTDQELVNYADLLIKENLCLEVIDLAWLLTTILNLSV